MFFVETSFQPPLASRSVLATEHVSKVYKGRLTHLNPPTYSCEARFLPLTMPSISSFKVPLLVTLILMTVTPTIAAVYNNSVSCSALSSVLHEKVSYPSDATYGASVRSYWFQEARLLPGCIVSPTSASDVALIVKTLVRKGASKSNSSSFAIRSGGHTPFAGAANIENGVTIDLRALNAVKLSADHRVTFAGAGSIWDDIYDMLQPLNLTVVGGRVAGLGVGGLTTGGGISFLSPQRGFACDNVVNMEIVLADGQIVHANTQQNPDLFTALKGGSNNFGIVTRFDFQTFSLGNFWGGFITYPSITIPQQLQAFETFIDPTNFDPHAEIIVAIGYVGAIQSVIVSNGIYYTKPAVDPPIFHPFTAIQPQLASTMRISNMTDFVNEEESQQVPNPRGIYVNTVFVPGGSILQETFALWNSTVDSIRNVSGIQHFMILQKVPTVVSGNSLGLDASEGPLVLCLLEIAWSQPRDDQYINKMAQKLIGRIEEATKAAKLFNRYKYLNYAANFQDPIGSYGAASKVNLQRISKKYDPTGIFQTSVPGGFKLFK